MSNEKKKQKKQTKNNLSNIVKESTEISSMSFWNGKMATFFISCSKYQTKELDDGGQFYAFLKRTSKIP